MRDPDKYVYVEVALPKASPSTQRIVTESEESGVALRVLVKQAVHRAYTDSDTEIRTVRQPKTRREPTNGKKKNAVKTDEPTVSASSLATADDFLSDSGF